MNDEYLKKCKDLLYYRNRLENINRMIKSYTDDWVECQKNIIKLEEELEKSK